MAPAGHEAMVKMLIKLAERPDLMMVMGAPRPGLDLGRSHRRLWADLSACHNTLVTADRAWLPIDVDGYGVPAPWGLAEHLRDAARAIRDDALGEEFAGVTCVVAATATTGLVGEETARLKLCVLLNRLHPLADLESWAKGAQVVGMPVDPAVMRPGQPIYTSLASRVWRAGILSPFISEPSCSPARPSGWRSTCIATTGSDSRSSQRCSRRRPLAVKTGGDCSIGRSAARPALRAAQSGARRRGSVRRQR